jgi:ketosteroid isomerase-like protein
MSTEQELKEVEEEWTRAILRNDAHAIGEFISPDWVIIGPDGAIIERSRFLGAIESCDLTHESMESDEMRVASYSETAVLTAKTRSRGSFQGRPFNTLERSTSVYTRVNGLWLCVLTQLTSIAE